MTSEGPARRRRAGRAFVALGVGCGLAALFVAGYASWQLWGTGGYEASAQAALREAYEAAVPEPSSLEDPDGERDEPATTTVPGSEPIAEDVDDELLPGGVDAVLMSARFPDTGEALAFLEIPAIDFTRFVMRNVSVDALRRGPGHYEGTVRPGFDGNAAIAGHRTTYGAPFGRVDELEPGHQIVVSTKEGRFTYEVMDPQVAFDGYEDEIDEYGPGFVVVDPDDTWIVGDFGDSRLTLTSCHPELTSRNRIVVTAQLVSDGLALPNFFTMIDPTLLDELVSEDLSVLDSPGTGADT